MTTVVHLDNTTVLAPGTEGTTTTEIVRNTVVVAGQLGPGSMNTLADLWDINIDAAEEGDILTKQGAYWTNTRRANVTDGGNF